MFENLEDILIKYEDLNAELASPGCNIGPEPFQETYERAERFDAACRGIYTIQEG